MVRALAACFAGAVADVSALADAVTNSVSNTIGKSFLAIKSFVLYLFIDVLDLGILFSPLKINCSFFSVRSLSSSSFEIGANGPTETIMAERKLPALCNEA